MNEFIASLNLGISIAIPLIVGQAVLCATFRKPLPRLLNYSLSYGIGLGGVVLWMLLLYTLGFSISRLTTSLPLLGISCAIHLWNFLRKSAEEPTDMAPLFLGQTVDGRMSLLEKSLWSIIWLYIIVSLILVVIKALTLPIMTYDAMATVAYKAKLFFFEDRPPSLAMLPHKTYPLLVAFSETWTALNLGYWHDAWVKIVFPVILLAFTVVHYYFLKACSNWKWASAGLALLLTSNLIVFHASISYRDIHLMYYNCCTIMAIALWFKSRNPRFLILAGFLAGLGSFTKLEGTAFLSIYTTLLGLSSIYLYRTNFLATVQNFMRFIIPSGLICGWYHFVKIVYGALKDGSGAIDKTGFELDLRNLALLPDVILTYRDNMFFTGNWNLIWLAALMSFILSFGRKQSAETYILLISLFLFIGLYTATALFSTNYVWIAGEKNITTLSRLFLHFFPLAVQYVVLSNFSALNHTRRIS